MFIFVKNNQIMLSTLALLSFIIIMCIILNKLSGKLGVPALLLFLVLGMIAGSLYPDFYVENGLKITEEICTISLIFIMFYGGFGTKWATAKPVALEAGLLATVGVALTALTVGLFCHYALKWGWEESLLMGSVISSTDAASVFSILRTHKLGLKNNSAPLIEMESGSNDPMSYMLTIVMLSVIRGKASGGLVVWTLASQIGIGAAAGVAIAFISVYFGRFLNLKNTGFSSMFFLAVAILSYALPSLIGGNGYLSTYIVGMVLGNVKSEDKSHIVHFFDGITSLMQIQIFFLLGFLAYPNRLVTVFVPALLIFLFMTIIGRTLAVSSVLVPFAKKKRYSIRQISFISFVGLRGAASIVFAIMILTSGVPFQHDIFHIVFCIVLMSILLQGSLIPLAARKFDMVDENCDVMKTFNDFNESKELSLGRMTITETDRTVGKTVVELCLPKDILLILIIRGDEHIIPHGDTVLLAGDSVVFCSRSYVSETDDMELIQHSLSPDSQWDGKRVMDYWNKDNNLLVLIKRGEQQIIPNGHTVFHHGDLLIYLKRK